MDRVDRANAMFTPRELTVVGNYGGTMGRHENAPVPPVHLATFSPLLAIGGLAYHERVGLRGHHQLLRGGAVMEIIKSNDERLREQSLLLERINDHADRVVEFVYFLHPHLVSLGSVNLKEDGVELAFFGTIRTMKSMRTTSS